MTQNGNNLQLKLTLMSFTLELNYMAQTCGDSNYAAILFNDPNATQIIYLLNYCVKAYHPMLVLRQRTTLILLCSWQLSQCGKPSCVLQYDAGVFSSKNMSMST